MRSERHPGAAPLALYASFGLIIALLLALALLAVDRVQAVDEKLERVALKRAQTEAVQTMRRAVRERFIRLNLITLSDDPFLQDELHIEFDLQAGRFLSARAALETGATDMTALPPLMAALNTLTSAGTPILARVLQAALDGDRARAQELLIGQALPLQREVVSQLEAIQQLLDDEHARSLAALDGELERTSRQILVIAIAATLLLGFIIAAVAHRIRRQHREMAAEIERRRRSEDALQASRAELESRVAARTAELASTTDLLSNVLSAAIDFSIIATDTDGVITVFNSGAEGLLGYRAKELIGVHTPALFHLPEEIAAREQELGAELGRPVKGFRVFVEKAERDGSETREWTYVCKSGRHVTVELTVTAWRDKYGRIRGYLGIAADISERKRVERMKSEFISTVSHELRTPLTAISGALGLLGSGRLGPLAEPAQEMARIAGRNSQRLGTLINDLLDMEKLAAGKLRLDLVAQPLQPVVEQAVRDNQTYADTFGVTLALVTGDDASARIDADRLQQVLANLLSNAAKFSPRGATVEVRLETLGERARISVTDHGPGISESFRERIFQKFSQADASDTRQRGGTGLGLAISRELVERMHGTIAFDSVEGHGATFRVEFPLTEEAR